MAHAVFPNRKRISARGGRHTHPYIRTQFARNITATQFEDETSWTLSAELPGVGEDGVKYEIHNGVLEITAEGNGSRYHGSFDIPQKPTEQDVTVTAQRDS